MKAYILKGDKVEVSVPLQFDWGILVQPIWKFTAESNMIINHCSVVQRTEFSPAKGGTVGSTPPGTTINL